ncbi:MAG: hypothetical protein CO013_04155 [Syntrophobacterales bacterium CG_4_8_14_3_um_filter_58_8]|nr:MAG: hypothetical protein AUK26_13945 [Syntrophaceae bacterium CG2_30_58_14]PIV04159.1 MAG: hypothetical protein COS57_09285 [Syntrophobacterales bacterium CG03_land_8_20_14_0_80_58_14]PJC74578.1 MAG: hypothetical protein CO013_04155 [Syntrophobacterales bacterium CG_4_8_14_3_um_filter_58_8]
MPIFMHNASLKKGAQERHIRIVLKKAFVIREMVDKPFVLPIVRAPGYIPSTIIGAAPHILWPIFP